MFDNIRNNRIEKTFKTVETTTGEKITYCSAEGTVADRLCLVCKQWVEVRGITEAILIKEGCRSCREKSKEDLGC